MVAQCQRPGAWEISRDGCHFGQPGPLSGAEAGISSPPFTPLDPCPHLPSFPGNSTHEDGRGEAVLPSDRPVSHRDATATMRSLHLTARVEYTSPTDLNGTREEVLWHQGSSGITPTTLQGLGGCWHICQPRRGMVRRERDGVPKWGVRDDCYQAGRDR